MAIVYNFRFAGLVLIIISMSKIRVLFTIPNFDTAGSGKAMLNIAMRLNKDLFEPHIACLNDNGVFFEKVKSSGIPYHIVPLYCPARPIKKLLSGVWQLSKIIKSINPQIVHSYNYSADYTEALAVKIAGKKWIFTKKNMSWGGSSTNAWKLRSFLANRIAIQNTDMLKNFYPTSSKVDLIPRGVNTKDYHPGSPVIGLREKWNIRPGSKIILCVANLVPVKGIEVLLQAYHQLYARKPDMDVTILIVGENNNDYGRSLAELATKLGISDKVIFTGKQQNIPDYHTIADIFALPTLDKGEGSPVALLEALACGTISIASDVPGIRDQLSDFPELMFPAGNAEELSGKLSALLDLSESKKKELKERLTKLVAENYKIEHEVEKHEQLYLTCMGKVRKL